MPRYAAFFKKLIFVIFIVIVIVFSADGVGDDAGAAATEDEPSDFVDDEYVIYDTAKQRLHYLVEFAMA